MGNMLSGLSQDKMKEIEFFNRYADMGDYNVFTDEANDKLISTCITAAKMEPGMLVADLGCGYGIFTRLLCAKGFKSIGLDINQALLDSAKKVDPTIEYIAGDVECLPFAADSLDAILLSGLIHHLPDPSKCVQEVYRVLKPNGVFAAFDPNRRNPFMWLYRDWDSPFYSNKGVTENERPIVASEIADIFEAVGFQVSTSYLSGLSYKYVASPAMMKLLAIYNFVDWLMFKPKFMKSYSPFVITTGVKK